MNIGAERTEVDKGNKTLLKEYQKNVMMMR